MRSKSAGGRWLAFRFGINGGGQPEVGTGLIGGGGLFSAATAGWALKSLEIILGADDYDAETAERYGWIHRAIDAELDGFVSNFVRRICLLTSWR